MKHVKRVVAILRSFRTRVTVVLVLTLLIMLGVSNLIIYRFTVNEQVEQLRERLKVIAQTAALMVDANQLIRVPLERNGVFSPEYKSISAQLRRIKQANPSIKYIYTMHRTMQPGTVRFIVDPDAEHQRMRRGPNSLPGDLYNAARFPQMLEGFTRPSADKKIMADEWGATLSGYAPVRDAAGRNVAILGVDMAADDVYASQKQLRISILGVLVFSLFIAVWLGVLISTRITDRIGKLVEATRKIADDDLEFKVNIRGHDEISELAGSFNHMAASLSQSRKKLHEYFFRAVQSLIRILEAKDPYTKGHSERVAEYARQIGVAMGFSAQRVELLEKAAELHDIGKLVIHESILNKPGKLTPEEWKIIQEHPVIGEEVLKPVLVDEALLAVVRAHHERYDGKGYPDGLHGNHIDIFAQIICVADSYDAMTSPRSYRQAMTKEAAVVELKMNAGTQFNPEVVSAFLEVLVR